MTDAVHIGGDSVDAVGVNATEVGEDEGFGYNESVGRMDAIAFKDGLDEFLSGSGRDVEFKG